MQITKTRFLPRLGLASVALSAVLACAAHAQDAMDSLPVVGQPHQGGMGFQPAATEVARDLQWLDHFMMVIMIAIVLLVVALLAIVALRFNSRANPTPARFTHNSPLEIAWTLIPILILVFIGAFSLPILFQQQEIPEADITIKVTGNQWFWSYDYVDDGFSFDSFLLPKDQLAANGYTDDEYLLAVDTPMVVPVGKIVVVQTTGADVIHSWTVPAFGVKQDAVPGRLAELWFAAEKEGIYFGQCSELCGKDHAYMPIAIRVVSEEQFTAWAESAGEDANIQPEKRGFCSRSSRIWRKA